MAEFEALPPAEMAKKAEDIGEKKANSSFSKTVQTFQSFFFSGKNNSNKNGKKKFF